MATELSAEPPVVADTSGAADTAQRYVTPDGRDGVLLQYCADFDAAKRRLEANDSAAERAFQEAYRRIVSHRAHTPGGVRTKVAVALIAHPELETDYPDVIHALSADLDRLA